MVVACPYDVLRWSLRFPSLSHQLPASQSRRMSQLRKKKKASGSGGGGGAGGEAEGGDLLPSVRPRVAALESAPIHVAVASFVAKRDDEISFQAGDRLFVVQNPTDYGWWEGALRDGSVGWFPAYFVSSNPVTFGTLPSPVTPSRIDPKRGDPPPIPRSGSVKKKRKEIVSVYENEDDNAADDLAKQASWFLGGCSRDEVCSSARKGAGESG